MRLHWIQNITSYLTPVSFHNLKVYIPSHCRRIVPYRCTGPSMDHLKLSKYPSMKVRMIGHIFFQGKKKLLASLDFSYCLFNELIWYVAITKNNKKIIYYWIMSQVNNWLPGILWNKAVVSMLSPPSKRVSKSLAPAFSLKYSII